MKKAFIFLSALVLICCAVGCKTAAEEGAAESQPVTEPEVKPFGLTLGWKVEKIPLSEPWMTKGEYGEKDFPDYGITVKQVLYDTQAEKEGFLPGDIIYGVGGRKFTTTAKFIKLIGRLEPGVKTPVMIVRTTKGGNLERKELKELYLQISTEDIKRFDFPLIFTYKKNNHVKSARVLGLFFYKRRVFCGQTWGIAPILPLYHKEQVGDVVTRRIFWIFKWRVGQENDITI